MSFFSFVMFDGLGLVGLVWVLKKFFEVEVLLFCLCLWRFSGFCMVFPGLFSLV